MGSEIEIGTMDVAYGMRNEIDSLIEVLEGYNADASDMTRPVMLNETHRLCNEIIDSAKAVKMEVEGWPRFDVEFHNGITMFDPDGPNHGQTKTVGRGFNETRNFVFDTVSLRYPNYGIVQTGEEPDGTSARWEVRLQDGTLAATIRAKDVEKVLPVK